MHEGDAGRRRLGHRQRGCSTPSMTIEPDVGATTPPRIFISVDLPAPFSPIRPEHLAAARRESSRRRAPSRPG